MSDSGFEFWIGEGTGDGAEASPGSGFYFTFGDTSALDSGSSARVGCSAGACPHPTSHPAEADWVRLASAVPVTGQLHRLVPRCEGMAYPTEEDFRSALAAVRPGTPDDHSLERLRAGWTEGIAAVLAEWPDLMKSKLAGLSADWAGDDFEAFASQVDLTRSLIDGVLDDIDATAEELRNREEAVYILQGGDSGEIPYPAPMVGFEGEWSELVAIHVRPAWWQGDCILMTCEEAERALELAGADASLATEVREFVEERVGEGMSGLGVLTADIRTLAGQEAEERFGPRVEAEMTAYSERQAAVDEDIAQRRADQDAEFEQLRATGDDRPYPAGADTAHMDLAEPEVERPPAPSSPETTQDPSPTPPGGDGSVRDEPEEDDESVQEAEDADESVSGGLASGGGFGGGPGGSPLGSPGGGAGPAAPSGSFGGLPPRRCRPPPEAAARAAPGRR